MYSCWYVEADADLLSGCGVDQGTICIAIAETQHSYYRAAVIGEQSKLILDTESAGLHCVDGRCALVEYFSDPADRCGVTDYEGTLDRAVPHEFDKCFAERRTKLQRSSKALRPSPVSMIPCAASLRK